MLVNEYVKLRIVIERRVRPSAIAATAVPRPMRNQSAFYSKWLYYYRYSLSIQEDILILVM
jgi:hypothetical protein